MTSMPKNSVCPRPGCGKRHTSPKQVAKCAASLNQSAGGSGTTAQRYGKPNKPGTVDTAAPFSPSFGNIRDAADLCALMTEIEPPDEYGRKWHDLETPDPDGNVYREYADELVVASASGKIPDPVGSIAFKLRTMRGGSDAYAAHGEPLGEVDENGNADAWRIWVDMTKAHKNHRHEIEDVGQILREGSPARKTDRAGPGTKGTSLVPPVGYEPIIVAYSEHARWR